MSVRNEPQAISSQARRLAIGAGFASVVIVEALVFGAGYTMGSTRPSENSSGNNDAVSPDRRTRTTNHFILTKNRALGWYTARPGKVDFDFDELVVDAQSRSCAVDIQGQISATGTLLTLTGPQCRPID